MNTSPSSVSFWAGLLVGMLGMFLFLIIAPSYCKSGRDAVHKCEAELPRNKHCEIIAVERKP